MYRKTARLAPRIRLCRKRDVGGHGRGIRRGGEHESAARQRNLVVYPFQRGRTHFVSFGRHVEIEDGNLRADCLCADHVDDYARAVTAVVGGCGDADGARVKRTDEPVFLHRYLPRFSRAVHGGKTQGVAAVCGVQRQHFHLKIGVVFVLRHIDCEHAVFRGRVDVHAGYGYGDGHRDGVRERHNREHYDERDDRHKRDNLVFHTPPSLTL